MKLSGFTIDVLRNFKQIHQSIIIEPGNVIKTAAIARNIVAEVEVDETFPNQVAIYDLAEFLSVMDLVAEPELHFHDNMVLIKDASGRTNVKYWFADPRNIKFDALTVKMPEPAVWFDLSQSALQQVRKASSILGHDTLCIEGNKQSVTLSVVDKDNETSNKFSVDVPGRADVDSYRLYFAIERMKMINADYKVEISPRLISHFESTTLPKSLHYWLPLEKASQFN